MTHPLQLDNIILRIIEVYLTFVETYKISLQIQTGLTEFHCFRNCQKKWEPDKN
jgi:hypothetical protein